MGFGVLSQQELSVYTCVHMCTFVYTLRDPVLKSSEISACGMINLSEFYKPFTYLMNFVFLEIFFIDSELVGRHFGKAAEEDAMFLLLQTAEIRIVSVQVAAPCIRKIYSLMQKGEPIKWMLSNKYTITLTDS